MTDQPDSDAKQVREYARKQLLAYLINERQTPEQTREWIETWLEAWCPLNPEEMAI